MRRTQLRANNKRLHADIGEKLGLSSEDANKLIDLITDQQMAAMQRGREERMTDAGGDRRVTSFEMNQQKNMAEITALIGADKAELYMAYQETMPARQEVNMLERQLEGIDSTLSKDQRERMITALAEERKRVPEPQLRGQRLPRGTHEGCAGLAGRLPGACRHSRAQHSQRRTTRHVQRVPAVEPGNAPAVRGASRRARKWHPGGPPGSAPQPRERRDLLTQAGN